MIFDLIVSQGRIADRTPGGLLPAQVRAIPERLPPEQVAGIELAEFEASGRCIAGRGRRRDHPRRRRLAARPCR